MNAIRRSSKRALGAALIGTMLLAAPLVWAQNPAPPATNTGGAAGPAQNHGAAGAASQLSQALGDLNGAAARDALLVGKLLDPADELLGATLQPVDDTLRAQLGIPAGQGLLVVHLRAEGASAQAGLKQNDILLSLAGNPLAAADDLTKQLKAAGEAAVPLKILRAGKPVTIQVRPIYRVTLGPIAEQKAEYYLGISIDVPGEAVRAQLDLPEGRGVVVNEVIAGSPAEKAGVKKHDIVLELEGKPIDDPQTLSRLVQAAQDRPTTLKVLHGGKEVTLAVTGTLRQVEVTLPQVADAWRLYTVDQAALTRLAAVSDLRMAVTAQAGADELRQRLDQVEKELRALRAAVEKVNELLKADKGTKRE